jgi:hypothetical protein
MVNCGKPSAARSWLYKPNTDAATSNTELDFVRKTRVSICRREIYSGRPRLAGF